MVVTEDSGNRMFSGMAAAPWDFSRPAVSTDMDQQPLDASIRHRAKSDQLKNKKLRFDVGLTPKRLLTSNAKCMQDVSG